jgi:hypothetical protein
VSDEQLRQFTSAAFSRPGYQLPVELLDEVRAITFHSLTTATQASRDYVKTSQELKCQAATED